MLKECDLGQFARVTSSSVNLASAVLVDEPCHGVAPAPLARLADNRERRKLCENTATFSHTAGLGLFSRSEVGQKQKNREKIFRCAIVRIFSTTFYTA